MNRTKKLFSNIAVFIVGNLGSKLISFLMVPLYTYYLTSGQFGTIDLLLTTINLCLPLVTLSLFDAVFRFTMDKRIDSGEVLSTGFFSTILFSGVSLLFFPLVKMFNVPHVGLFFLILFFTAIFTMFQNFTRAFGYSRVFATSGIINTFIFASVNIVLLVFFHGGVEAYLESYLIAIIVSIVYLVLKVKIWNKIKVNQYSYGLLKSMLHYSVPLIPNSLAWWFTNDSSRYFILAFVGVSANGMFAVANKIPTIINMFFTIFTQAWQISAIDEFESRDSSEYYSKVFRNLLQFLFILVGVLILVLKPGMRILFSLSYYDAWHYVPILLISVVFADISAFLGTVYLAAKKTISVFSTTVCGMIVNVTLSALLTPILGVYGAGVSMVVGFFVVILLRLHSIKKFVRIVMPWGKFASLIFSLSVMLVGVYSPNNDFIGVAITILGFVFMLVMNRDFLGDVMVVFQSIKKK